MTERELRLRGRIDTLTTERDKHLLERRKLRTMVNNLIGQRRRELLGHCVYCGAHCKGKACGEHRDLVQLDPGMGATSL